MAQTLTVADMKKLKVTELKEILKEHGLATTGNKSDLLERLLTFNKTSSNSSTNTEVFEENILDDELLDATVQSLPTKLVPAVDVDTYSKKTGGNSASSVTTNPPQLRTNPVPSSGGMDARLSRFGVVSEQARKAARAERFKCENSSMMHHDTGSKTSDVKNDGGDRMKKRAERFGGLSNKISPTDVQDRILKRKERFGATTVTSESNISIEQKQRRVERFGLTSSV